MIMATVGIIQGAILLLDDLEEESKGSKGMCNEIAKTNRRRQKKALYAHQLNLSHHDLIECMLLYMH